MLPWGQIDCGGDQWDFDEYPLIPDAIQYEPEDTTGTAEKEKEDQQKLKNADIAGAVVGGLMGISGGPEGVLTGALVGAIEESLKEYVIIQLDKTAVLMPEDDVLTINTNSYFYMFLVEEKERDLSAFHEKYGYKFDDIL